MKYLVDSSVILTMLVNPDKEYGTKVGEFIDGLRGEIYALELTKIEVSNGLIYSLGSPFEVEKAYNNFVDSGYRFIEVDDEGLKYARQIAKSVKDTVYDALYHSYSLINSMTFLTLDRKYYKKAHTLGNIELIEV